MIADDRFRFDAPEHFVVACHEPLLLVTAVVVGGGHVGGNGHHAALFDAVKAEVKGGLVAPVDCWNDTDALAGPICAAPAVAEHVIKLHHRSHFKIHTEIRRQHGTVAGEPLQADIRRFPDLLKAIVIEKKVYHAVKVALACRFCLVKPNQQKIVEVVIFRLELWNDGNLQFPLARELIAEHGLAGAIVIVFFRHREPSCYDGEQVPLYRRRKTGFVV